MSELRPAGVEGVSQWNSILSRRNSPCKGPEAGLLPGVIKEQEEAGVWGMEDGVRGWPGPGHSTLWASARGLDLIPSMPVIIPRTGPGTLQLLC